MGEGFRGGNGGKVLEEENSLFESSFGGTSVSGGSEKDDIKVKQVPDVKSRNVRNRVVHNCTTSGSRIKIRKLPLQNRNLKGEVNKQKMLKRKMVKTVEKKADLYKSQSKSLYPNIENYKGHRKLKLNYMKSPLKKMVKLNADLKSFIKSKRKNIRRPKRVKSAARKVRKSKKKRKRRRSMEYPGVNNYIYNQSIVILG